jgi:Pyridoxamine 5'-phosphate oxidase
MASWSDFEAEAPELAAAAREFLEARTHKTIATLRRDGSPRISGTEATFHDGDLWWGSMANAVKALDLRRDPRFALHSGSADPTDWQGDAKVAGRAEELTGKLRTAAVESLGWELSADSHLFRADIEEVAVVRLNEERTKLLIDSWAPGRTVRRIER